MKAASRRSTPDVVSWLGLLIGIGGIVLGLLAEGGRIGDVMQATGAVVVLSGTIGAVMISTPTAVFWRSLKSVRLVFCEPRRSTTDLIALIVHLSNRARRNGIVSLESDLEQTEDPFLRKALVLAIDGASLDELRSTMETEIEIERFNGRASAKVFEAAGGYSPTIGIIGAVLGLMQVMKSLHDIERVGHGIAVSFVATVYGVALANLFFLPVAGKIRTRVDEAAQFRMLMLEGVSGIVQGAHPKMIERRLESWSVTDACNRVGVQVLAERRIEEAA